MSQLNQSTTPPPATRSLVHLDDCAIKSYATEDNLMKAMQRDGVDKVRHVIVRTPKTGRWTALVIGFQQQLLGTGWAMVS